MSWKRVIGIVRVASAMTAGASLSAKALASLGIDIAPASDLLQDFLQIALSTPVSMIAAAVVGQWIGEAVDARSYRIEGGTGRASKRHLVRRLRFTRQILKRPFWYPNEDRLVRELARTNRALKAVGIAEIEALRGDRNEKNEAIRDDYICCLIALMKALGVDRTARLSPAIKRRARVLENKLLQTS